MAHTKEFKKPIQVALAKEVLVKNEYENGYKQALKDYGIIIDEDTECLIEAQLQKRKLRFRLLKDSSYSPDKLIQLPDGNVISTTCPNCIEEGMCINEDNRVSCLICGNIDPKFI